MGAITKKQDRAIGTKHSRAIMPAGGEASAAYKPTVYQMIDSLIIRNFRSFNEVKLDDCRRINILVGENGSGKTALLEALFITAGVSPELTLRTRAWRGGGFEDQKVSGSQEDLYRAIWGDLFHNFQTSKPAFVSLKGEDDQTRSVTVTLNPRGKVRVITPPRDKPGAPVRVVPERSPIEFKWKIHGHADVTVAPRFEGGNLTFPAVPDAHVKAAFIASNRNPLNSELIERFSKLSRDFHEQEFIDKYSRLYKNVKNLSIEMSAGTPMLFAKVGKLSEKIPLTLASGGMTKLAAILLAMSDQTGGIIIVDEIENGFYYKQLPMVWRALYEFAQLYECQLFVSTHSAECLEAASVLAAEHTEDFSVIRTVLEDGETKLRHFGGDKFVAAMEDHIDIR